MHTSNGCIKEDGPIMLKIIYDCINPSTRVGVWNLTNKLDSMNLVDCDQIVPDMVDTYENTYNLILEKQESHSN